jgi:hypothetical protein
MRFRRVVSPRSVTPLASWSRGSFRSDQRGGRLCRCQRRFPCRTLAVGPSSSAWSTSATTAPGCARRSQSRRMCASSWRPRCTRIARSRRTPACRIATGTFPAGTRVLRWPLTPGSNETITTDLGWHIEPIDNCPPATADLLRVAGRRIPRRLPDPQGHGLHPRPRHHRRSSPPLSLERRQPRGDVRPAALANR